MRILLVDDCRDTTETLAALLSLWHHKVYAASSGKEALEHAASVDPQVAIVDLLLPDIRGDRLAALLRELRPAMFVAGLSGIPGPMLAPKTVRAFDCYWTKPVDLEYLRVFLDSTHGSP